MKRFLITCFLFTAVLSYSANIKLERIGIINLKKVVEVCFKGKSPAVKQLMDEKEKFQNDLDAIKIKIQAQQELLENETDEKKKIAAEKKVKELREQYTNFYRKKMAEIERKENTIQAPLYEEIYDIVRRIAETEGFSIILKDNADNLFYYNTESDITEKVIEYFNRNP
ncbi:MAG: OmpH family outer membrane protein [Spirochaetales bacterium]|nr:OmpH family outer membrane protein [Spirochaetales bacterium]